jgi:hypothetical protein
MNIHGYQETFQTRETCMLCSNPFPFVCNACKTTIDQAMMDDEGRNEKKIFIGSGEDLPFA